MEIKILELMENRIKFLLSDATPDTANTLRRTLVSDVPKMAIETVDFHLGPISDEEGYEYESVTPLFDEMIAHRLGLIPIPTDLSLYSYKEECVCEGEGCPNCSIMYSLNKKGPCDVFSGDLEPLGNQELRVKDELIPIVKLGEGQAILIYASAELGTARNHAKWQVTNGVGYKYYPTVKIDGKKCDRGGSCVRACPHGVFEKADRAALPADVRQVFELRCDPRPQPRVVETDIRVFDRIANGDLALETPAVALGILANQQPDHIGDILVG